LDRCPTGTGVSARLAVLHAKGGLAGEQLVMESVIRSTFTGRIVSETSVEGIPLIV